MLILFRGDDLRIIKFESPRPRKQVEFIRIRVELKPNSKLRRSVVFDAYIEWLNCPMSQMPRFDNRTPDETKLDEQFTLCM